MQISITIPDDKLTEVIDALCSAYNYDEKKLKDETKAQFAKRQIINFVKEVVKSNRIDKAVEITREAENAKPDILIT